MTIRKIDLVNKKGKVTGSVYCKETLCKPIMDDISFEHFFDAKIPLTMIVVGRRKKKKCRKM